jgi:hypothetical protein
MDMIIFAIGISMFILCAALTCFFTVIKQVTAL